MPSRRGFAFLALVTTACTAFGGPGTEVLPDGATPPPIASAERDASVTDAAAPPGEDAAVSSCQGVPRGTDVVCKACTAEPFVAADASPAAGVPSGLVTDAENLYWIEQRGASSNVGKGTSWLVKRVPLSGAAVPVDMTPVLMSPAPRTMLVSGNRLWFARDATIDGGVAWIDKACALSCTPQVAGTLGRLTAIASHGDKVVATTKNELRLFAGGGTDEVLSSLRPQTGDEGGLTFLGGKLFRGRDDANAKQIDPLDATDLPAALLTTHPTGGAMRGVLRLASDCNGFWAVQSFDRGFLLVRATQAGPARAVMSNADTSQNSFPFVLRADSSHVYAGLPDGHGIWRAARETGNAVQVVQGVSVWDLAVGVDAVYFADHDSRDIRRLKKTP